jgi:hypothetical protein
MRRVRNNVNLGLFALLAFLTGMLLGFSRVAAQAKLPPNPVACYMQACFNLSGSLESNSACPGCSGYMKINSSWACGQSATQGCCQYVEWQIWCSGAYTYYELDLNGTYPGDSCNGDPTRPGVCAPHGPVGPPP